MPLLYYTAILLRPAGRWAIHTLQECGAPSAASPAGGAGGCSCGGGRFGEIRTENEQGQPNIKKGAGGGEAKVMCS